MVKDRALDESGRAGHPILRCPTCGDIIDPVILVNRMCWPESKKRLYLRRFVFGIYSSST